MSFGTKEKIKISVPNLLLRNCIRLWMERVLRLGKKATSSNRWQKPSTKLEAVYEYPFQAHAPLETMNCIADVKKDSCEIWVSTQTPETAYEEVA